MFFPKRKANADADRRYSPVNDYVLFTDSTCDLTQKLADSLHIHVIPMEFILGDTAYLHYLDGREMSMKSFYSQVRSGAMPTTTQINQFVYLEAFTPFLEEGKDILYLCFSSGLSGTYQSSRLAVEELQEKYPERKIYSVDTRCASIGEGTLVYETAVKMNDGMSIDELRDYAESIRLRINHWFTVNDLFHLHRGGRVSAVTAIAGAALGIKPMLTVNPEGKLDTVSKVRGRNKAMEYIATRAVENLGSIENPVLFIGHADCPDDAKELEKIVRSKVKCKKVYISDIGPIIGAHVGPGMLALTFLGEHR